MLSTHIVSDSSVSHENQSGSSIRDGSKPRLRVSCGAHFIRSGRVLPETVRVVNCGIFDSASVFRRVSVSKIIGSIGIVWQIGSKQGRVKTRLSVVKESLLLSWGDCHA